HRVRSRDLWQGRPEPRRPCLRGRTINPSEKDQINRESLNLQSAIQASQAALRELPNQIVERGLKAGATDVVGQIEIEKRRMVRFSNNSITVTMTWDVSVPLST